MNKNSKNYLMLLYYMEKNIAVPMLIWLVPPMSVVLIDKEEPTDIHRIFHVGDCIEWAFIESNTNNGSSFYKGIISGFIKSNRGDNSIDQIRVVVYEGTGNYIKFDINTEKRIRGNFEKIFLPTKPTDIPKNDPTFNNRVNEIIFNAISRSQLGTKTPLGTAIGGYKRMYSKKRKIKTKSNIIKTSNKK